MSESPDLRQSTGSPVGQPGVCPFCEQQVSRQCLGPNEATYCEHMPPTTPLEQEPTIPDPPRRHRYEIQVARFDSSQWTARCYHEDGEHVWSSEQAPSIDTALREIARAIKEDDR